MFEVYEVMKHLGSQPTFQTFSDMMNAAHETAKWDVVSNLYSVMMGNQMPLESHHHIMVCYAHANLGNWRQLLTSLNYVDVDAGLELDDWFKILELAVQAEEFNIALDIFRIARKSGGHRDLRTLEHMITVYRRLGMWQEALTVDKEISKLQRNWDDKDEFVSF